MNVVDKNPGAFLWHPQPLAALQRALRIVMKRFIPFFFHEQEIYVTHIVQYREGAPASL
jgi:hypothetical protein